MKKLILVLAVMTFSCGMYAQDAKSSKATKSTSSTTATTSSSNDYIMMKDDKLWVMKNGKTTSMYEPMSLSDGSTIAVDGTVTMQDGSTRMMQNGYSIGMDGVVSTGEKPRNDKSKMSK